MAGRTFLRQNAQIAASRTFDDNLAAGIALESSSSNLETDLNALRSQVNRILDDAGGNWYDDIPTVNGKQRSILDLNTDLNTLEEKKALCRVSLLTDITVPASQNFVVLSAAGSQTPSVPAAVAPTTDGAVVAQSALSAGAFAAHELIEVAGDDATNPKNLMVVRSAADGSVLQSSGRDVFALLQYEATGVDGGNFDDVSGGNRAKLSFVRLNATFDDLEAVPVSDIENVAINYSYVQRFAFENLPEQCFLANGSFVDNSGNVTVNRQVSYNNQGTTPVELSTNADLDLGAGVQWSIRDAADADLLQISEGSAGGTSTVLIAGDVDVLDVDAVDNDFANGASFDTTGTPIQVAETAGEIERAADLRLRASGAGELFFADSNEPVSWAPDGIKLSEDAQNWVDFEAAFGEVSLLEAILQANQSAGSVVKTCTAVSADIAANASAGGPATANNLTDDLQALAGFVSAGVGDATFPSNNDVYLNGQLLRGGINAAADCDYYPGASAPELAFEFDLVAANGSQPADVVCVITRS